MPLLTANYGLLLGALLIALVVYAPLHPWDWKTVLTWVEFGFLIRFQVIGGALLAILLPAGFFAAPSIFAGIFDAQSFLSFVFVVYVARQLALIVMITAGWHSSTDRCGLQELRLCPWPAKLRGG